jgi:hypothetical protein
MKKLMEDVMGVEADDRNPFLSSFKKPLEKVQREKEQRAEAKTKKIMKGTAEDKAFVRHV